MWNVVTDTIIYAKETNANEVQGKLNEDSWIALVMKCQQYGSKSSKIAT